MVILIAEDYDDTCSPFGMLLQIKSHCVLEAVNGQEAVDLATHERPDLILMDLNMPVMHGSGYGSGDRSGRRSARRRRR